MAAATSVKAPLLPTNPSSADFKFFKRTFTNYLDIIAADPSQKLPLLLNSLGRDGLDIFDGLPDPKNDYDKAMDKLSAYFEGTSTTLLRRKLFYEARQKSHESVNEFAVRLRRLSSECSYPTSVVQELLRDVFVFGLFDDRLAQQLLAVDAAKLTFDTALKKAEVFERAHMERKPSEVNSVGKPSNVSRANRQCYRCGSCDHVANYDKCPAKSATCHQCSKIGHFKSQCRSKKIAKPDSCQISEPIGTSNDRTSTLVSNVTDPVQPSCGSRPTLFSVTSVNACSRSDSSDDMKRNVIINGKATVAIIDTGASMNVLPLKMFPNAKFSPTHVKLNAWGAIPLKVVGELSCSIRYKERRADETFIVVDTDENSVPLMSSSLCRKLGLFQELVPAGPELAQSVSATDFTSTFPEVFEGTGLIKNVEVKLHVKENAVPYSVPNRRLPLALHSQVKKELDKMVEDDIITPVSDPTPWCSPIVVVKKKDDKIRICCDYRELNKYVKRQHFPIPRLDDLLASVTNAECFSLLDCKSAYYQVRVSSDSQHFLTFGTPFGRYTFKRLPFGICTAPEIFQKVMSDMLSDLPGVVVYIDDILVFGSCPKEHNERVTAVLEILSKNGVCVKAEKCIFGSSQVDFLGHSLSKDGISPSPKKVESVNSMTLPCTKPQLRSFLGLASYVGHKFVPNLAQITRPLWNLVQKCSPEKLSWSDNDKLAFQNTKNAISRISTLAWFKSGEESVLQTDASGTAIAAVLMQNGLPVAYASRMLTETEKRYSQLEREFLGIVFGLLKFRQIVLGNSCVVQTDHKAIIALMDKRIDTLPLRLQRWILKIQEFSVEYQFIQGKDNVLADALSRNCNTSLQDESMDDVEYSVCFILKATPLNLKEVAEATAQDPLLTKLLQCIQNNWQDYSNDSEIRNAMKPFYHFRDELSAKFSEDHSTFLILKGRLVILPEKLQRTVLDLVHEGHLGITKMKQNIRNFAYWPNYSSDIENYVKYCPACVSIQNKSDKLPLSEVANESTAPWEMISVDLTGPSDLLQGRTLLTIIDHFSRFPEVFILSDTSSKSIIDALTSLFARYGLPEKLLSDNGSNFVSTEFENFLASTMTQHFRTSNFHPQTNGVLERFHGSLKLRLRKLMTFDKLPLHLAIEKVLYDLRSSPHEVTGATPYEKMFGRPMRTKLSQITLHDQSPSTVPRDIEADYSKRFVPREVQYQAGDQVLCRKGRTEKFFTHPAEISKRVGRGAYQVKLPNGYFRVYNQCNLKLLPPLPNSDSIGHDNDFPVIDMDDCDSPDLPENNRNSPRGSPRPTIRRQPQRARRLPPGLDGFIFY